MEFPDERLVDILVKLLTDSHEDCHFFAFCTLGDIAKLTKNQIAYDAILKYREDLVDEDLLDEINQVIKDAEQVD